MKANDWISVKDRLPEIGEEVLVCSEKNNVQWWGVAAIVSDDESTIWLHIDGYLLHDVTHWQPIVLPKKEKK